VPTDSRIETSRLVLRLHRLDDFEAALAMWSDPDVTRFIGGKPSTPQQVWMRILNYAGHWELLGFGYWAVEDAQTGDFVGEVGFADFHREIDESMRHVPELGWAFASHARGRGFATEAVAAALLWIDSHVRALRTVCLINDKNLASIRVAEKSGYAKFASRDYSNEPTSFFERYIP
jgi:RimJ/RimL family protein N-acetyltransferase